MKITICGSVSFWGEMQELEKKLRKMGFEDVFMPVPTKNKDKLTDIEHAERKIKLDLINEHYIKILKSDCILVANYEKKGMVGYIGGNSFLEMGFAFVNRRPIYLLHEIPEMGYKAEILGMRPVVLDKNLSQLKNILKK